MSNENHKRGARPREFLLSEASGARSRSTIIIASGSGKLEAGTVLGQIAASKKFTASPADAVAGIEGAETASAILGYPVDATDQDVEIAAIERDAEVKAWALRYDATVDDQPKTDAKIDQLAAVGIVAR